MVNGLQFRADTKLTDFFKDHTFTLSAEVIPPRNGAETAQILTSIEGLIGAGAQFLAVTKGAGGSLRGGSLPIAQTIKERLGVPCIAHFTCRDLTPPEVENQLMDHHYFGIRNILALRGDPPDGATAEWKPRDGGYSYAHELITQIRNLNQGVFLTREGGPSAHQEERPDFCIGAAVYPDHPEPTERIEFFRRKVDAGADYAITDMLFDPERYAKFVEDCDRAGVRRIPILPGTRVLRSRKQAARMQAKFRVHIPAHVLQALPEDEEPGALPERGIELFLKQVEQLKRYGAPGIHLFVVVDPAGAQAALKRMR